ncbi:hypothetical protein WJX84_006688 [Apatococcus fuscideae]|uniref:Uncharacterized protein n=1 Tax=Apatococcus fuscideae TaxID=2026836 RepID=A0AAW1SU55_9CHLO
MARKTVALLSVIPLLGVSFTEARNFVPVVINTWPFTEATSTAWQALEQGKASLDAVEEGCERCQVLITTGTKFRASVKETPKSGITLSRATVLARHAREMEQLGSAAR